MTVDQQIGEKLRSARVAAQFETADAANRLAVSEFELKQFETGLIRISSNLVHRAAKLYGVEIRWFFEFGSQKSGIVTDRTHMSEESLQALQSLRANKTLSRLCEAMRESDYAGTTEKFVA